MINGLALLKSTQVGIDFSNDAEKAYINTHTIKYCINPSGLPFEGLNEDGETCWNEFGLLSSF